MFVIKKSYEGSEGIGIYIYTQAFAIQEINEEPSKLFSLQH